MNYSVVTPSAAVAAKPQSQQGGLFTLGSDAGDISMGSSSRRGSFFAIAAVAAAGCGCAIATIVYHRAKRRRRAGDEEEEDAKRTRQCGMGRGEKVCSAEANVVAIPPLPSSSADAVAPPDRGTSTTATTSSSSCRVVAPCPPLPLPFLLPAILSASVTVGCPSRRSGSQSTRNGIIHQRQQRQSMRDTVVHGTTTSAYQSTEAAILIGNSMSHHEHGTSTIARSKTRQVKIGLRDVLLAAMAEVTPIEDWEHRHHHSPDGDVAPSSSLFSAPLPHQEGLKEVMAATAAYLGSSTHGKGSSRELLCTDGDRDTGCRDDPSAQPHLERLCGALVAAFPLMTVHAEAEAPAPPPPLLLFQKLAWSLQGQSSLMHGGSSPPSPPSLSLSLASSPHSTHNTLFNFIGFEQTLRAQRSLAMVVVSLAPSFLLAEGAKGCDGGAERRKKKFKNKRRGAASNSDLADAKVATTAADQRKTNIVTGNDNSHSATTGGGGGGGRRYIFGRGFLRACRNSLALLLCGACRRAVDGTCGVVTHALIKGLLGSVVGIAASPSHCTAALGDNSSSSPSSFYPPVRRASSSTGAEGGVTAAGGEEEGKKGLANDNGSQPASAAFVGGRRSGEKRASSQWRDATTLVPVWSADDLFDAAMAADVSHTGGGVGSSSSPSTPIFSGPPQELHSVERRARQQQCSPSASRAVVSLGGAGSDDDSEEGHHACDHQQGTGEDGEFVGYFDYYSAPSASSSSSFSSSWAKSSSSFSEDDDDSDRPPAADYDARFPNFGSAAAVSALGEASHHPHPQAYDDAVEHRQQPTVISWLLTLPPSVAISLVAVATKGFMMAVSVTRVLAGGPEGGRRRGRGGAKGTEGGADGQATSTRSNSLRRIDSSTSSSSSGTTTTSSSNGYGGRGGGLLSHSNDDDEIGGASSSHSLLSATASPTTMSKVIGRTERRLHRGGGGGGAGVGGSGIFGTAVVSPTGQGVDHHNPSSLNSTRRGGDRHHPEATGTSAGGDEGEVLSGWWARKLNRFKFLIVSAHNSLIQLSELRATRGGMGDDNTYYDHADDEDGGAVPPPPRSYAARHYYEVKTNQPLRNTQRRRARRLIQSVAQRQQSTATHHAFSGLGPHHDHNPLGRLGGGSGGDPSSSSSAPPPPDATIHLPIPGLQLTLSCPLLNTQWSMEPPISSYGVDGTFPSWGRADARARQRKIHQQQQHSRHADNDYDYGDADQQTKRAQQLLRRRLLILHGVVADVGGDNRQQYPPAATVPPAKKAPSARLSSPSMPMKMASTAAVLSRRATSFVERRLSLAAAFDNSPPPAPAARTQAERGDGADEEAVDTPITMFSGDGGAPLIECVEGTIPPPEDGDGDANLDNKNATSDAAGVLFVRSPTTDDDGDGEPTSLVITSSRGTIGNQERQQRCDDDTDDEREDYRNPFRGHHDHGGVASMCRPSATAGDGERLLCLDASASIVSTSASESYTSVTTFDDDDDDNDNDDHGGGDGQQQHSSPFASFGSFRRAAGMLGMGGEGGDVVATPTRTYCNTPAYTTAANSPQTPAMCGSQSYHHHHHALPAMEEGVLLSGRGGVGGSSPFSHLQHQHQHRQQNSVRNNSSGGDLGVLAPNVMMHSTENLSATTATAAMVDEIVEAIVPTKAGGGPPPPPSSFVFSPPPPSFFEGAEGDGDATADAQRDRRAATERKLSVREKLRRGEEGSDDATANTNTKHLLSLLAEEEKESVCAPPFPPSSTTAFSSSFAVPVFTASPSSVAPAASKPFTAVQFKCNSAAAQRDVAAPTLINIIVEDMLAHPMSAEAYVAASDAERAFDIPQLEHLERYLKAATHVVFEPDAACLVESSRPMYVTRQEGGDAGGCAEAASSREEGGDAGGGGDAEAEAEAVVDAAATAAAEVASPAGVHTAAGAVPPATSIVDGSVLDLVSYAHTTYAARQEALAALKRHQHSAHHLNNLNRSHHHTPLHHTNSSGMRGRQRGVCSQHAGPSSGGVVGVGTALGATTAGGSGVDCRSPSSSSAAAMKDDTAGRGLLISPTSSSIMMTPNACTSSSSAAAAGASGGKRGGGGGGGGRRASAVTLLLSTPPPLSHHHHHTPGEARGSGDASNHPRVVSPALDPLLTHDHSSLSNHRSSHSRNTNRAVLHHHYGGGGSVFDSFGTPSSPLLQRFARGRRGSTGSVVVGTPATINTTVSEGGGGLGWASRSTLPFCSNSSRYGGADGSTCVPYRRCSFGGGDSSVAHDTVSVFPSSMTAGPSPPPSSAQPHAVAAPPYCSSAGPSSCTPHGAARCRRRPHSAPSPPPPLNPLSRLALLKREAVDTLAFHLAYDREEREQLRHLAKLEGDMLREARTGGGWGRDTLAGGGGGGGDEDYDFNATKAYGGNDTRPVTPSPFSSPLPPLQGSPSSPTAATCINRDGAATATTTNTNTTSRRLYVDALQANPPRRMVRRTHLNCKYVATMTEPLAGPSPRSGGGESAGAGGSGGGGAGRGGDASSSLYYSANALCVVSFIIIKGRLAFVVQLQCRREQLTLDAALPTYLSVVMQVVSQICGVPLGAMVKVPPIYRHKPTIGLEAVLPPPSSTAAAGDDSLSTEGCGVSDHHKEVAGADDDASPSLLPVARPKEKGSPSSSSSSCSFPIDVSGNCLQYDIPMNPPAITSSSSSSPSPSVVAVVVPLFWNRSVHFFSNAKMRGSLTSAGGIGGGGGGGSRSSNTRVGGFASVFAEEEVLRKLSALLFPSSPSPKSSATVLSGASPSPSPSPPPIVVDEEVQRRMLSLLLRGAVTNTHNGEESREESRAAGQRTTKETDAGEAANDEGSLLSSFSFSFSPERYSKALSCGQAPLSTAYCPWLGDALAVIEYLTTARLFPMGAGAGRTVSSPASALNATTTAECRVRGNADDREKGASTPRRTRRLRKRRQAKSSRGRGGGALRGIAAARAEQVMIMGGGAFAASVSASSSPFLSPQGIRRTCSVDQQHNNEIHHHRVVTFGGVDGGASSPGNGSMSLAFGGGGGEGCSFAPHRAAADAYDEDEDYDGVIMGTIPDESSDHSSSPSRGGGRGSLVLSASGNYHSTQHYPPTHPHQQYPNHTHHNHTHSQHLLHYNGQRLSSTFDSVCDEAYGSGGGTTMTRYTSDHTGGGGGGGGGYGFVPSAAARAPPSPSRGGGSGNAAIIPPTASPVLMRCSEQQNRSGDHHHRHQHTTSAGVGGGASGSDSSPSSPFGSPLKFSQKCRLATATDPSDDHHHSGRVLSVGSGGDSHLLGRGRRHRHHSRKARRVDAVNEEEEDGVIFSPPLSPSSTVVVDCEGTDSRGGGGGGGGGGGEDADTAAVTSSFGAVPVISSPEDGAVGAHAAFGSSSCTPPSTPPSGVPTFPTPSATEMVAGALPPSFPPPNAQATYGVTNNKTVANSSSTINSSNSAADVGLHVVAALCAFNDPISPLSTVIVSRGPPSSAHAAGGGGGGGVHDAPSPPNNAPLPPSLVNAIIMAACSRALSPHFPSSDTHPQQQQQQHHATTTITIDAYAFLPLLCRALAAARAILRGGGRGGVCGCAGADEEESIIVAQSVLIATAAAVVGEGTALPSFNTADPLYSLESAMLQGGRSFALWPSSSSSSSSLSCARTPVDSIVEALHRNDNVAINAHGDGNTSGNGSLYGGLLSLSKDDHHHHHHHSHHRHHVVEEDEEGMKRKDGPSSRPQCLVVLPSSSSLGSSAGAELGTFVVVTGSTYGLGTEHLRAYASAISIHTAAEANADHSPATTSSSSNAQRVIVSYLHRPSGIRYQLSSASRTITAAAPSMGPSSSPLGSRRNGSGGGDNRKLQQPLLHSSGATLSLNPLRPDRTVFFSQLFGSQQQHNSGNGCCWGTSGGDYGHGHGAMGMGGLVVKDVRAFTRRQQQQRYSRFYHSSSSFAFASSSSWVDRNPLLTSDYLFAACSDYCDPSVAATMRIGIHRVVGVSSPAMLHGEEKRRRGRRGRDRIRSVSSPSASFSSSSSLIAYARAAAITATIASLYPQQFPSGPITQYVVVNTGVYKGLVEEAVEEDDRRRMAEQRRRVGGGGVGSSMHGGGSGGGSGSGGFASSTSSSFMAHGSSRNGGVFGSHNRMGSLHNGGGGGGLATSSSLVRMPPPPTSSSTSSFIGNVGGVSAGGSGSVKGRADHNLFPTAAAKSIQRLVVQQQQQQQLSGGAHSNTTIVMVGRRPTIVANTNSAHANVVMATSASSSPTAHPAATVPPHTRVGSPPTVVDAVAAAASAAVASSSTSVSMPLLLSPLAMSTADVNAVDGEGGGSGTPTHFNANGRNGAAADEPMLSASTTPTPGTFALVEGRLPPPLAAEGGGDGEALLPLQYMHGDRVRRGNHRNSSHRHNNNGGNNTNITNAVISVNANGRPYSATLGATSSSSSTHAAAGAASGGVPGGGRRGMRGSAAGPTLISTVTFGGSAQSPSGGSTTVTGTRRSGGGAEPHGQAAAAPSRTTTTMTRTVSVFSSPPTPAFNANAAASSSQHIANPLALPPAAVGAVTSNSARTSRAGSLFVHHTPHQPLTGGVSNRGTPPPQHYHSRTGTATSTAAAAEGDGSGDVAIAIPSTSLSRRRQHHGHNGDSLGGGGDSSDAARNNNTNSAAAHNPSSSSSILVDAIVHYAPFGHFGGGCGNANAGGGGIIVEATSTPSSSPSPSTLEVGGGSGSVPSPTPLIGLVHHTADGFEAAMRARRALWGGGGGGGGVGGEGGDLVPEARGGRRDSFVPPASERSFYHQARLPPTVYSNYGNMARLSSPSALTSLSTSSSTNNPAVSSFFHGCQPTPPTSNMASNMKNPTATAAAVLPSFVTPSCSKFTAANDDGGGANDGANPNHTYIDNGRYGRSVVLWYLFSSSGVPSAALSQGEPRVEFVLIGVVPRPSSRRRRRARRGKKGDHHHRGDDISSGSDSEEEDVLVNVSWTRPAFGREGGRLNNDRMGAGTSSSIGSFSSPLGHSNASSFAGGVGGGSGGSGTASFDFGLVASCIGGLAELQ